MEAIKEKLLEKGGTAGDWGSLITNGLQGGRLGGDVLAQARAVMSRDAILEYDCVDDRGRDQGQAWVRLLDWEDFSRGLLRAEHLVASDGYYEWYGSHELAGGKGVYHICSNPRGQCAERLGRSDRRQLIHMHRWRMTSPLVMMESAHAKPVALKAMENWVNNFQARVPSPSRPPAPPGAGGGNDTTGLDKEVEAAEEADEPGKKKATVKKAPVAEEVSEKTPRGSVGAVLERKAAERRETMRAREVEKKRARERARSRSRGRRRKRRSDRTSSGGVSSSCSRSSKSSQGFRRPSTRGEDDLWRQSKRNPGKLLKTTMLELSRYLADRAPGAEEESDWTSHRMMAYISQVVLCQHPPQAMGVRNHRELVTLGKAIDLLLSGQLGELGDLLVQRLKAVETAVADQNWSTARHQEPSGLADNRAGEEESGPDGARPREAQGASVEGAKAGQIGTRRRDESRAITRDAMERGADGGEGDSAEEASGAGRNAPRDQEGRPPERKGGRLESTRKRGVEADAKERKRQRPGSPGSLVEPRGSGEGRRKPEEEPDTPQTIEEQESFETIGLEEEADHSLQVLKAWLQSEECRGLTISQSGALLALTAFRSGTPLGILLGRMVRPGSDDGEERSRQRSLLPLPLWKDSRDALAALFDSGEFRRLAGSWATKKANKEKAARLSRKNGLLIWHGLVVTLINHLWSGGGSKAAVCLQEPSKAQTGALDRLWIVVRDFVDDTSESKEKVLKSPPLGDWATKLADVRISYHGEIVEKSHQLTLDQVKPGLPPSGYGASVPLVELCDGELQEKLMKPLANLLPEDELPADIPKPKVHANQEQWNLIARDLYERGLVEPVEDPLMVKGKVVTNGAFGVVKPGKFLEDERPILRLIMDFRATNAVCRVLTGDVRSLTGAAALQHVVLPESKVLRLSADDLVAAFYLFALPAGWSKLMTFATKVPWKILGIEKEGAVHIGAKVLPMGWASAVGVLQHAHRRLALRSPLAGPGLLGKCEIRRDAVFPDLEKEGSLWSLYLDDANLMEVMSRRVAAELEGLPSEEQQRLRRAYQHWGIPISLDKAVVRAPSAEKLGAVIDGEGGVLKTSTKRALESLSLGFWLMRQDEVPRKALQVFLGREVHTLQFRRPLFGILDYVWKDISEGGVLTQLGSKSIEEILMCGMSQPLRATDLRAKLHEVVTASDASESGGGMVYGSKLTTEGLKELQALEDGMDEPIAEKVSLDEQQVILVLDFFAGIGGLSRALQLAQVEVQRLVVIEQDVKCRRLNAGRWPGCDLVVDIKKLKRKERERVLRSVPGLTGVIARGGSPCQGLEVVSKSSTP